MIPASVNIFLACVEIDITGTWGVWSNGEWFPMNPDDQIWIRKENEFTDSFTAEVFIIDITDRLGNLVRKAAKLHRVISNRP